MGNIGHAFVHTFLNSKVLTQGRKHLVDTVVEYWHKLHTSPDLHTHVFIPKFFEFSWTKTVGRLALLPYLLNLTIPLSLVYGENDKMAPPEQGQLVAYLTDTRVYVIANAPHSPYHIRKGRDFADVVLHARDHSSVPGPHAHALAVHLHGDSLIRWSHYSGSWSFSSSHRTERMLYKDVLDAYLALPSFSTGAPNILVQEPVAGNERHQRSHGEAVVADATCEEQTLSAEARVKSAGSSKILQMLYTAAEELSRPLTDGWLTLKARLLIATFTKGTTGAPTFSVRNTLSSLYANMTRSFKRTIVAVEENSTEQCMLPTEFRDDIASIPSLCLPGGPKEAVVDVMGISGSVVMISFEWTQAHPVEAPTLS
jgi:hypothetical protein